MPPVETEQPDPPQLSVTQEHGLFRVKVTLHRIAVITLSLGFIITKSIAAYRNQAVTSTTLDWLFAAVVGILLWWVGLYETVNPPVWNWWLHTDHSRGARDFLTIVFTSALVYSATLFSIHFGSDLSVIVFTVVDSGVAIFSGFAPSMVGLHLVNRDDLGLVQSLPYWAKWLWIPSLSLVLLVVILRSLIGVFTSFMTTDDASSIDIPPSPTLSNRSSLTSVIEELDPDIDPFPFSFRPLSLARMLDPKDFDTLEKMGGTADLLRGLGSNAKHGLSKQDVMAHNPNSAFRGGRDRD